MSVAIECEGARGKPEFDAVLLVPAFIFYRQGVAWYLVAQVLLGERGTAIRGIGLRGEQDNPTAASGLAEKPRRILA